MRERITRKERKKDHEDTSNLQWQHHQYCWKDINEKNPMTPRKIMNGDRKGSHEPSKYVGTHLPSNSSYDSPRPPLMIFLDIIEFVLLRSFQRYWWCHYQRFGVSPGSFSFSLWREMKDKKVKKKVKRSQRHTEAPMTTPHVLLKRSQREESNGIK